MKIIKFGGSSVGTPDMVNRVIDIIQDNLNKGFTFAVIFSAFKKVTNQLISAGELAAQGKASYQEIFREIENRHIDTVRQLISARNQSKVLSHLISELNELQDVLHGIYLVKEISPRTMDFVMSFGERFSAYIISEALLDRSIDCEYLDARNLVKTDNHFGAAKVKFEITNQNIREYFKSHPRLQIITGFIGSTLNNETTTLGRGGSDFTASIFGAALNASVIEIWTDVDGVMTADPRKVEKAFTIPHLTFEEAMELSHFGAEVVHPATMQPALENKIPIRIKNTFNPLAEGTLISNTVPTTSRIIKGLSSIDDIALINVIGSGMIGVAGIAQRIFGALARKSINIILITQASSEHSVCFAVLPWHAEKAKRAIEEEFRTEIQEKKINDIIVEKDLSIIAVVGENMRKTPGISGKVFQALGKNGINISAIAQGSSELNISMVVSKTDETKALNAIHDAFFLSNVKTANIFLVGPGLIGGTLLKQMKNQRDYLRQEYSLQMNIIGITNTRRMLFKIDGIDPMEWEVELYGRGKDANLEEFIETMKELNLPNSIFVDCTSSDEVVAKYKEILSANISIVTPNKKANSSSYDFYLDLRHTALKHNVKFAYEANVGAGLPIINTLKDLISSGDKVLKIEGVLSGTLSYIFNTFKEGKTFSETVKEAQEKGYTEPDPREDLNGLDVARKLLILAREIGFKIELKDIKVENLVPEPARQAKTVEEFFEKLKEFDEVFEQRRKSAQKKGCVLRYIARIEAGRAETALREVDASHPFYSLFGSDNILAFTTKNCKDRPIVVQGPGAGAEVTAAGVFADIIRIANYLS